jgi:hypothetical protein
MFYNLSNNLDKSKLYTPKLLDTIMWQSFMYDATANTNAQWRGSKLRKSTVTNAPSEK